MSRRACRAPTPRICVTPACGRNRPGTDSLRGATPTMRSISSSAVKAVSRSSSGWKCVSRRSPAGQRVALPASPTSKPPPRPPCNSLRTVRARWSCSTAASSTSRRAKATRSRCPRASRPCSWWRPSHAMRRRHAVSRASSRRAVKRAVRRHLELALSTADELRLWHLRHAASPILNRLAPLGALHGFANIAAVFIEPIAGLDRLSPTAARLPRARARALRRQRHPARVR